MDLTRSGPVDQTLVPPVANSIRKRDVAKVAGFSVAVLAGAAIAAACAAAVAGKFFNVDISDLPLNNLLANEYVVYGLIAGTGVAVVGLPILGVALFKKKEVKLAPPALNLDGARGAERSSSSSSSGSASGSAEPLLKNKKRKDSEPEGDSSYGSLVNHSAGSSPLDSSPRNGNSGPTTSQPVMGSYMGSSFTTSSQS